MADHTVTEYQVLIKQQILSQELVSSYLEQIEAMVKLTLGDEFLGSSSLIQHAYLSVLEDLTSSAKAHNIQSLNYLTRSTLDRVK